MKANKISVIVPVFNVENYLEKCVKSIIEQTYKNLEVILVDDGSTDKSGFLCDELKKQDYRIKVIHKTNGGLSDARNAGIQVSTGKYLSFIDSDDYLERTALEQMMQAILISHSEIAICNIMRFYDDGCTEEFYNPTDNQEVLEGIRRFDTLNQPSVCNKLFDAKLFANISFPYGKFYEDTYVYHELLYKADKVVLTGKTGYWYLSRKGSILGRSQFSNRYFDFIEAVYMRADFLIKRDIQPYGDEAFLSLYAALANAEKNIDHKLNKDDFKRSKDYYRDILDGYGACELSWIDDFKLEIPKDIIAELLQLENEKVIKINEDNIEMLENFDTNNLNETQKYLLSCIEDGKVKNISEIKLQETVRKDALKHKIVEQREESKKKKKKRMFKAILIAVIVNIVMRVAFNIISEMNFENNMIPIISFVIYVIALMIFALYPTIVIISFIIYNVKSTLDPYFRTKEGEELNRSIEGLKNYLKDYTLLDEQEKDGIVVWEEYLVYSVLFNQNKKMIEKYKSIVK